ncbi:MAG: glutamine amidotransferase [Cyanobacteria bacterium P01_D01_bin.36]
MPSKIITLIHKDTTIPGVVGQKLTEMGYELEIRAPILGDALPTNFEDYAGALVFGGPMSVNDDEPYLHAEAAWVKKLLAAKLPYLGICLGAQLLAKVLGAKVGPHAQGLEEIGYYPIYATPEGRALFPDTLKAYQWHNEGFELPEGAVLLATGDNFPQQAFRWGDRTYGLQFHPEMTADMVTFWTEQGADLLGAPNAQPREAQILGHKHHSQTVGDWLETFLNNWLSPVRELA